MSVPAQSAWPQAKHIECSIHSQKTFNASSLYATAEKCLIFKAATHQPTTSKSILDDLSIVTRDNPKPHTYNLEVERPTALISTVARTKDICPHFMEKSEKSALVKIALLAFGWPLALNHFYEGNPGMGLTALLGTWIAWGTIFGIVVWIFPYFHALFKALREFEGNPRQHEERPPLDPKRQ